MNEEPLSVRVIRFGTFELDLRARQLCQGGLDLKLEAMPLQLLELLVEKAGELVTRKEMREKLWPGSFVEFDRSINTAMSKLRKALGDAIDSPRYIETRFRLGYRFIAPVGGADVSARSWLRPVPLHARNTDQPVPIRFTTPQEEASPSTTPLAVIANPKVDGDALRFQMRRSDGNLAELSVRLTATTEGGLNMRLDLCGARSEGGTAVSARAKSGSHYSHHAGHSRLSLRRARP